MCSVNARILEATSKPDQSHHNIHTLSRQTTIPSVYPHHCTAYTGDHPTSDLRAKLGSRVAPGVSRRPEIMGPRHNTTVLNSVNVAETQTCYVVAVVAAGRKEALVHEQVPSTTLGWTRPNGAVEISEGDVAFWDRSQRETKTCMQVRQYMAFRISPNICGMDWRDRNFYNPCSYLPILRECVHHLKGVEKLTFSTYIILGVDKQGAMS